MYFKFGNLSFDDDCFVLKRDGQAVPLRPKAVDVLLMLLSAPRRVITKDKLLQQVWHDVTVSEDSLTQCIHEIRAAIGDENAEMVRTVRGRGYMLEANVAQMPATAPAPQSNRHDRRRRTAFQIGALVAVVTVSAAAAGWRITERGPQLPVGQITEQSLLRAGTTILGAPFNYPEGSPEVFAAIVTIPPGAERTWHVHTSPNFVYVLEGTVEVEYANGEVRELRDGMAMIEAIGEPHRARSRGSGAARVLSVNIGAEGLAVRRPADPSGPAETPASGISLSQKSD